MTVATVTLNSGKSVKLGRVRPKARPQCLAFGHYLKRMEGAVLPPPVVDYSAKAMASLSQMLGNDQWGDCVIAGKLHQLGIWSGNDADHDPPGTVVASTQEAVSQYHAICGPGDNGCNIADVLNVFKSRGLRAGGRVYTIDGYVSVDWTNKLEVQVALYLFGSLTLGINLPQAWLDAPDGGLWDATNSRIVGGHDVCAVGYNETGVVIATWGGLRTITWAAFTSQRWVEEAYAQLAPLWYGSDKLAPCGVAAATLQADLAKLADGTIPPLDPSPEPHPEPPPLPPGPPVPPPAAPLVVTGTASGVISVPSGPFGRTVSVSISLPVTGFAKPAQANAEFHLLPFHALTRIRVARTLRETQGLSEQDAHEIAQAMSGAFIDGVADAHGVPVEFRKRGGGNGSIIQAILDWLSNPANQAFIMALIRLFMGL